MNVNQMHEEASQTALEMNQIDSMQFIQVKRPSCPAVDVVEAKYRNDGYELVWDKHINNRLAKGWEYATQSDGKGIQCDNLFLYARKKQTIPIGVEPEPPSNEAQEAETVEIVADGSPVEPPSVANEVATVIKEPEFEKPEKPGSKKASKKSENPETKKEK